MSTATVPRSDRERGLTPYLTLAAGALFVAVPPLVVLVTGDAFLLMGLAGLLLLAALPGLHRAQQGGDGRSGSWGLRLILLGLSTVVALILSGDLIDAAVDGTAQDVAEGAFMVLGAVSGAALVLGVLLFAVGMTKARVFPATAIWVFLGGMMVGLVSEAFEQSLRGPVPLLADALPPLGFMIAGTGLLGIGRSAFHRRRLG